MEQAQAKKKLPSWAKTAVVLLALAAILWTAWAVFTDVIVLRKTEDMAGPESAVSILFVGNSHVFAGDVPRQLQAIARMHGVEMIYKDISRHANRGGTLSALKESAIGEIQSGRFDYVVLTCHGRRISNDSAEFLENVGILSGEARENGVIPVLYNSAWTADPERLDIATEAYKRAAGEMDIVLVNAAGAWVYAHQTIPGISLITRFDPRGPHANSAGGFLTACVFAATLFDLHVEDIPKDNLYKGHDATALAQAAWAFVHPPPHDE